VIGKDTRSADILRFLYEYTADNYGRSPSSREIASAVGLSSTNSVHIYLKRLVEAGYIELVDGGARNIRIVGAWYSNPPLPDELAAQYNEGYTTRDLGDLYGVSQRRSRLG
jgi:SOS-response transcriptional repressor LexA